MHSACNKRSGRWRRSTRWTTLAPALIGRDAECIGGLWQAWPGVLARIRDSRIRNFVIYLREPENLLFGHFEYTGDDLDADMAAMAAMSADPVTQRWWAHIDPCQRPMQSAEPHEKGVYMDEVFFAP